MKTLSIEPTASADTTPVGFFRLSRLSLSAVVALAFAISACEQRDAEAADPATPLDAKPAVEVKSDAKPDAKPSAVDKSNFDEVVLKSDKVVLVDFWATWCGPCKAIAPTVEEIAEDYAGRVVVAKLDVDVADAIATKYGVQILPTLMVFKDGKVVGTVPQNRMPTKEDIVKLLDENL